jgi:acetolactate decarboxylase
MIRRAVFFVLALMLNVSRPSADEKSVIAMWQNEPVIALLNGYYQGVSTVNDALRRGDLGLGAYADINGEMLVVDGNMFQITSDGHVHRPSGGSSLSFASMIHFHADQEIPLPEGTTFDNLGSVVDAILGRSNQYFALRIDGTFSDVLTRALPRQARPYPPFCQVVKTQPTFDYPNTSGTMVGFRGPPYVFDFNTVGFHLHYLTDDRSGGGHVLKFASKLAVLKIQRVDQVVTDFPLDPEFSTIDLSAIVSCP